MLGDMLRRLRTDEERATAAGRSTNVDAVAAALGLDRSSIYRWEDGSRMPQGPTLARLLDHYGATADERAEATALLARHLGLSLGVA